MRLTINGYPVTTQFGAVDGIHKLPHKGVDFAMPYGTPVEAVGSGTVTSISDEGTRSFGKAVHLHLDSGTDVIYGHLSGFNVKAGQHVNAGDTVGFVGSTGDSTGPHLHLQAMVGNQPVDPMPLVQKSSDGLLDKLNPMKGLENQIAELNHRIDSFVYWINPVHWFQHLWAWLVDFVQSGQIDIFMMAVLIVGIMVWMVGVKAHKKYVAWTFIGYLAIRGAFS